MMVSPFRVRVPASSANLGPGFDCLGLALGLYHELLVEPLSERRDPIPEVHMNLLGEGADTLSTSTDNMVVRTLLEVLAADGYDGPDLQLTSANDVPLARGLGSSAVAYLAGAAAGQWLSKGAIDRHALLEGGREREGHADNVAPCVLGGITVACTTPTGVQCIRLAPPNDVEAVLAVPDFSLSTSNSRNVLPRQVSRDDAVHTVSRACLLIAALARGCPEALHTAMADERLHEPYRESLVPGLPQVREASLAAGAWGAALSGAGPAVLALSPSAAKADVGAAMAQAWQAQNVTCTILHLPVVADGLQVHAQTEEDTKTL
jgi:homoserine kinase